MKVKPKLRRVYAPDEKRTHYAADALSGNVTLCGQTDWLSSKESGYDTTKPVDCPGCIAIVDHVQGGTR